MPKDRSRNSSHCAFGTRKNLRFRIGLTKLICRTAFDLKIQNPTARINKIHI